jgi:HAD superfamily hydrolase (TIGR01509 family)
MRPIEAVFFDLGNVLAFHDDARLFRRLSDWGGAAPDKIRERMLLLWDPINRGTLAGDELRQTICRVAGASLPMDEATFFEVWNCHFRVHDALLPMVETLFGRVKVLLLSNTNERHWRFVQPLIPQLARFDDLVISHELLLAKPDPAIFRVALDRAGVAPERVAYFDDVPRFVDAARAFGIHGRVFTTAANFHTQLEELGLARQPLVD